MNTIDLKEFLNEKRAVNKKRVKAYWIPKGQMFEAHRNYGGSTTKHVSRGSPGNIGGSTANWPRNQYFPKKMRESYHSDDMNHRMKREIQKEEHYIHRLLPTNTRREHDCLKKYEPNEKARGAKVAEHHHKPSTFDPNRKTSAEGEGIYLPCGHPHKFIPSYLATLETPPEIRQEACNLACNLANDSLRTTVYVRFKSEVVARGVVYAATLRFQVPPPENPPWWKVFDADKSWIEDIFRVLDQLYSLPKARYIPVRKEGGSFATSN
ncbi:hypothetical protein F511_43001 [Dorcoceras hygrometricum]|uniref:Uncharacterized protein n=1 Tax=Dorcoceras hygrometricum TaxID=472368 RepID=A0A2Z7CP07_9LAMI|nr:hypothetical protein F511_43001 [Dorcoceras hygrometricum]